MIQAKRIQVATLAKRCTLVMLPFFAAACWASGASVGYSGQAFGTTVKVTAGAVGVTSGTTAAAVLCTFSPGETDSNRIAGVELGGILSTRAITTSLSSQQSGSTQSSVGMANVAGVTLLGGIISVDALMAVSSATSSPSGYSTSAALPGIGEVILNEQQSTVTANSTQMTVTLIDIRVSQSNSLGLPVGSTVKVGSATASTIAAISLLNGDAYGSAVSAPPVNLGATAPITLPCGGTTGGEVISNDTAGITVPAVLAVGATVSTAQGEVSASSATAATTSTVTQFNLLSSLMKPAAIHAAANGSVTNSGSSFSDTGSSFGGLIVAGHPEIGVNPAPNTEVQIAGLGTLYLHRVIQTSTSIEVRMVELVVTLQNSLGLPIGADVRLAVAKVGDVLP